MKRIATALALSPSLAFAHGAHLPVPEYAHGAAHAGPLAVIVLVAAAVALLLRYWGTRQ